MELDEIRKRTFLREYMEARKRELAAPKHPCEDMSLEEIFSFVTFLHGERANSLHYASHKGAEVSAIYHTFISTCKMVGVSALDYMKKVFSELLTGSNDYAGLLPHAIALK